MISKVKCRPRRSVQWKVEMWGLSGPHFWVSNFNMLYFGHFAYNRFINCRSPPLLLPNTIPLHEYSSTVTCTYDLSVKLISSVVLPVLHSPLPNNEGSHFLRTWCKPPENSDVFTKVLHSACPVYNPLLRICHLGFRMVASAPALYLLTSGLVRTFSLDLKLYQENGIPLPYSLPAKSLLLFRL